MIRLKLLKIVFVVILLAAVSSCSISGAGQNCTIITASNEANTIYVNNEDTHYGNLIIGFFPAASGKYGSVRFGYIIGEVQSFQGAVNDRGLIWDVNSIPKTKLNPHPEKKYSHEKDNFLSMLTAYAATVGEAIELSREFDFGDSMALQFHIADASGDAVVIGPGPDGEIAYTMKGNDRFLISTNFNLAAARRECWRYDAAQRSLSMHGDEDYTIELMGDIADEVHLRTLTSFTLYSNIVDLTNKKIYLYYMSQFEERVELDIEEELANGRRIIPMKELFTEKTIEAGDKDYKRFENRFKAVKITAVILAVVLVAGIIMLIVYLIKRRNKNERKGHHRKD